MNEDLVVNTIFGERNVPSILLFLHLYGPATKTDVYHAVSTNPRMPIKIDMLIGYGLIETQFLENPTRRILSLTPLGMRFSMALIDLEKSCGGNISDFKWDAGKVLLERYGLSEEA